MQRDRAAASRTGSAVVKPRVPVETLGPPMDTANAMAYRIFQRTAATGMVAVVVRGNETWMAGYGRVTPGSAETPQADSLVRLCSISKILATDLLARLAAAKKLDLHDPLQKFAPDGVTVAAKAAPGESPRPVELIDLATHTAGMPREIAYPPQGFAHFTFPDYAFRWQWMPNFRPRVVPGTAAHYSNIGFDLLADAIASASGETYQNFFSQEIAGPLQLQDTTLSPTADQCTRLMSSPREPSECTDTQAAGGSGGMYSSARDMARLLRYYLQLPGVPVHAEKDATAVVLDPASLRSIQGLGHAGLPTGLGLGWVEINALNGPARIVEKTGGGAGFQTYIALNPARHAGIFFARTEGRGRPAGNMFREANDMLLAMVGLPPVPADPNDPERELTAEELREANAKPRPGKAGRGASARNLRTASAARRPQPVTKARAVTAHGVKRVQRQPAASKAASRTRSRAGKRPRSA